MTPATSYTVTGERSETVTTMRPYALLALGVMEQCVKDLSRGVGVDAWGDWLTREDADCYPLSFENSLHMVNIVMEGMGHGEIDQEWLRGIFRHRPDDAVKMVRHLKSIVHFY